MEVPSTKAEKEAEITEQLKKKIFSSKSYQDLSTCSKRWREVVKKTEREFTKNVEEKVLSREECDKVCVKRLVPRSILIREQIARKTYRSLARKSSTLESKNYQIQKAIKKEANENITVPVIMTVNEYEEYKKVFQSTHGVVNFPEPEKKEGYTTGKITMGEIDLVILENIERTAPLNKRLEQ